MSEFTKTFGETPYIGEKMSESPRQLNLFENQETTISKQGFEEALRTFEAKRERSSPSFSKTLVNSLMTFNLAPSQNVGKHLRKAKVAHSIQESIASDWNNISQDIYISFLRKALEENRHVE